MPSRTFVVAPAESGRPLAQALRERLALSWSAARRLVRERRVRVAGRPCLDPARRLTPGQRVEVEQPAPATLASPAAPPRPAGIAVCFQDAQVGVVDKPAGLTTMRHPDEA